jgi:hypothetical protein
MGYWGNLFGKKEEDKKPQVFTEKDNMGMRQDTLSKANTYWITRNMSQKFDPFAVYVFAREGDARDALLSLDCIHRANDTGKLICTKTLTFGYYQIEDGRFEAIIAGEELDHDLWTAAKENFIKHGGTRKNDQEPEKKAAPPTVTTKPEPEKVTFVREDRQQKMGHTMIYRIYKAPDAASAKAFLAQNPINKNFFYIIVETPEGNYGRDIEGIYKE